MLINEMRSGDVTLSWVHTNLVLKNFKNLRKVKAFKVLGMKMIVLSHGLNILLKKMPLFVYHAFLFHKPTGHDGQNAFTVNGFKSWKKVRNGESCSFSLHMGKDLNSAHRIAHKACLDLMNQSQHIDRVVRNFTSEQIANNRV